MNSARGIHTTPDLHQTMLGQASHVLGIAPDERDALIVSMRKVDDVSVVFSRYGDDVWWPSGATTNTVKANTKLDFTAIPVPFKQVTKAVMYRLTRRGRAGQKRPGVGQLFRTLGNIRLFLEYVHELGITNLSAITPLVCSTYVQKCRTLKTEGRGKKGQKRERSLTSATLSKRFVAIEALYELSQYTTDAIVQHPWPDSSARHLAGYNDEDREGGSKTPLIPDEIFARLFKGAWDIVQGAGHVLDLRDELAKVAASHSGLARYGLNKRKNQVLKTFGWDGGLPMLNTKLIEIRTACYIVIASLSGCRNHEVAFLQSEAYYSTEDDEGERYWWMRSRSTKTDENDTQWMIPEAAVSALKIMERWAKPYQGRLRDEIDAYRAANPTDVRIAEAQEHLGAVFVGSDKKQDNQVRTISVQRWNAQLRKFALALNIDWDLASHQFRRKFANYAARSQFGDLRYLREHFKHWSLDMTLGYAMNESQEMSLYLEIEDELEQIKEGVVARWLDKSEPLAGGYGLNIVNWRSRTENITLFKNHAQMVRSIAQSTAIRSNGHAWCTADDNQCVGNDVERTRCGGGCENAVIERRHGAIYQGLLDALTTLEHCEDIGEGGRSRVQRDLVRCRSVLSSLGYDPAGGEA